MGATGQGNQHPQSKASPVEAANSSEVGPTWRFGTESVASGLDRGTFEVASSINSDTTARAVFSEAALTAGAIEFRAEAVIEAGGKQWFRGWVTGSTPSEDGVLIEARNGLVLTEKRIAGLAHSGITDTELVWSIGRLAGFPEDHLAISGLRRTPDVFEVVMPVRGMKIDADLRAGSVRITADREQVERDLSFVGESGDRTRYAFLESGVWAIASIQADMILDAERWGSAEILGSLDRVALEAQYSLSYAPDGSVPAFKREGLFANLAADPIVVVKATRTRRRWLRLQRDIVYAPVLQERRVRLNAAPVGSDRRFDEALRAWRRATRASDPIEAIGALWEAIEFYVAKTRLPAVFTKPDLRRLGDAIAAVHLTDSQRERIPEMLRSGNQAPLLLRLREVLRRDGVPFTDAEMDVLRRLRDHRNDFVHGRRRDDPDQNDLDLALGFVNRMLAFRSGSAAP